MGSNVCECGLFCVQCAVQCALQISEQYAMKCKMKEYSVQNRECSMECITRRVEAVTRWPGLSLLLAVERGGGGGSKR